MKVAIYAGMFKENYDGSAITLYELTDSLLKNQIEVGVWAFSVTSQQKKGLSLYTIPSIPFPLQRDYRVSLPNPKLKMQLREFNPDVLHIAVPDMVGVSLMRFARMRRIPVLTSFHTDFPSYLKFYRLGFFYKAAWKFFKRFYNKSEVVLVPTEELIDKLKNNGIQNTKLWPRGVHTNKYSPGFRSQTLRLKWGARDKKVILYCGRFVRYKNLDTFIDVYNLFKTHGPGDVLFVLAGDGPIRNELEKRMPDAYFPGYLGGEELSRIYASSDLFLFPSTTETFGNVVLEALSSGLPVVVSDVGGCKEIVRKSGAGLIANADDPMDFFQNCKRLMEDKTLYGKLQRKGLGFAKSQNWEVINGRIIEKYRSLLFPPN